jgi:hypothetical protein
MMYLVVLCSPAKMGMVEKKQLESVLELSLRLCIIFLRRCPHLILVISKVFDPKLPFYTGTVICWRPGRIL